MRWIGLLIISGVLGCSQQAVRGTHLKIKMLTPQKAVLLLVDGDGRISYGGGFDAIQEKTSWQGKITSDQQLQFDELIASSGWLEPDSTRSQQSQGYDIRIQQGTIDNSFLLPLSDKSATTMFELLQTIALARLEPTLNALPKPSMDTIIDRKVNSTVEE